MKKISLIPVFLISAVAVGFEISLTRYFSIVSWSEYGYWVISITMVGFAVSGVVLSIFKNFFERHTRQILSIIPLLLLITATIGYLTITIIPFNPLEFQNPNTWLDQLFNIWKYYAALFPFFFLSGLFIGTYFLSGLKSIPRVYAADLIGAGMGTLFMLVMMFFIHPFLLLNLLLPLLAIAAFFQPPPTQIRRGIFLTIFILLTILSEVSIVKFNQADFNQYKSIYSSIHVQDNKTIKEIRSPRGFFLVLDNFTERLDVDFSNNANLLKATAPPAAYGLYKDGNRIAAIPKQETYTGTYLPATLDVFPYYLRPNASTLLIGTEGGFRLLETVKLGITSLTALEPDPILYSLIQNNSEITQILANPQVKLISATPMALAVGGEEKYDIIDIASNFLSQSDSNKYIFTSEALRDYMRMLKSDGIISIPDSIRESSTYSLKILETVYQTLLAMGIDAPQDHVLVYRSSWNDRILISPSVFTAKDVQKLRVFTDQRSFDISYFNGITKDINVWNDLPAVSFETGKITSGGDTVSDALRDDILQLFSAKHDEFVKNNFFRIKPATLNQPDFYSILRFSKLKSILNNIALVPQGEMGALINIAILLQSILIAIIILLLPLIRWRKYLPKARDLMKPIFYFSGLGLGFLFLEIYLIGKASFFLNDGMYGFAVILASMLIFSGLGSFWSEKYIPRPRSGLVLACGAVLLWLIIMWFFLDPLLLALIAIPTFLKYLVLIIITAPLSIALGFPFSLGLSLFRGERDRLLPWAWSVNGSFSVIATPLANIIILSLGYKIILAFSAILYIIVFIAYPSLQNKYET
jgi:MFS family permease